MHRLRMLTIADTRDLLQWLQRMTTPLARRGLLLFMQVDDPLVPVYIDIAVDGCAQYATPESVLAQRLARYLGGRWRYRFIRGLLARRPEEFAEDEIEHLAAQSYRRLRAAEGAARADDPEDRPRLSAPLQEALREARDLSIDGFLRFRCGAWIDDIHSAVGESLDEYLIHREYDEFVDILRYFLETTPVTPGTVYVVCKGASAIGLGEDMSPLDLTAMEQIALRSETRELHPQDVLMSALITRSPEKLVLVARDPAEVFAQTLARVFAGRLEVWGEGPECDHLMAAIDNARPTPYTS